MKKRVNTYTTQATGRRSKPRVKTALTRRGKGAAQLRTRQRMKM